MEERGEVCRVHILRKRDSAKWEALAARGDSDAEICILAAGKFFRLMAEEPSWCGCCEALFALGDTPQAFVILIPVELDPKNLTARTFAVCAECAKKEDQWLIDQGVRRNGLTPMRASPRDRIH